MKDEKSGEAVYVEKWSAWFWTVRSGNRVFYFGPYQSKEKAETKGKREAE